MDDDQLAVYLDDIRDKIARYGHAVQQVGGAPGSPVWSYTIGLRAVLLPELIIVGGVAGQAQQQILNTLAARMRTGDELAVGKRDPAVLEGVEVTYLEVADTTTELFTIANHVQSAFRALQVVWPDTENRFPWEPGYGFAPGAQPLLGEPPPPA